MTNDKMAENYIRQAEYRLREVSNALKDEMWEVAVRQSQEAIELALKASLRYVGIEPPKWHDVGEIVEAEVSRFPDWFKESVNDIIDVSRDLRSKRELSFYGDEASGKTPAEIFGRTDAESSFRDAQMIFGLCKRLITREEGQSVEERKR
ncbi:MAG: HEPN domain-containing protein [bacterium]